MKNLLFTLILLASQNNFCSEAKAFTKHNKTKVNFQGEYEIAEAPGKEIIIIKKGYCSSTKNTTNKNLYVNFTLKGYVLEDVIFTLPLSYFCRQSSTSGHSISSAYLVFKESTEQIEWYYNPSDIDTYLYIKLNEEFMKNLIESFRKIKSYRNESSCVIS